MVDVKEFKDDPLYKALENSGFSAEDIATMVANGDVTFEKSKSVAEMKESEKKEDKNIGNDEKHIDDLKKDEKEDKKDKKDLKEDIKEKEDKVEKSFSMDDMKAFGASLAANIVKGMTEVMNERFGNIEKSLESFGAQTPSFKGVQPSAVLEKAMKPEVDEEGKTLLSVTKQRPLVMAAINKAIENAGEELEKSIGDDALVFLANTEADTVGKDLAKFMYEKYNIKLQK
jgi:ABC-type Zn2+ transport system substrate-binding protein/surface adhesin